MDTEDPRDRLRQLPTFTQPSPTLTAEPPETATEDTGSRTHPSEPASPKQDPNGTRTPTSATTGSPIGKPKAAEVAGLVTGLLALALVGVGAVVAWRTGRKLRKPNKKQTANIAEPIGRILLRHADLAWLNDDLADLLQAGAATGDYLSDGSLLEGPAGLLDDGIPHDLQEASA